VSIGKLDVDAWSMKAERGGSLGKGVMGRCTLLKKDYFWDN
jgi:hypothetical protein